MDLATTPDLPGCRSVRSLGVVCGESVVGADFMKDLLASITNVMGGRSRAYESEIRQARATALAEMAKEAKELGGNAVVGIRLDYEVLGQAMLMVCASGTAVVSQPLAPD
ncbi:YbjQ family protein [Candidatus Poribacteria bacterium]|nr:YbjQ family protein [Candidatus Poribacteria bacterium]